MHGNYTIKLIQGDLLETYFTPDVKQRPIAKVLFSCSPLNLVIDLEYVLEKEAYLLKLNSNVSASLKPGFYFYDITIEFEDGDKLTFIHNGDLMVLKKKNKIETEDIINKET